MRVEPTDQTPGTSKQSTLRPRWFTVREVAQMLEFGETKVRMLIISGELRSLKAGRARRVLPEWVDEYVSRQVARAEAERP